MYVLRTEENSKAVAQERAAFTLEFEQAKAEKRPLGYVPDWVSPRPGDALVDRALRTVYVIAASGARERLRDKVTAAKILDHVRSEIDKIQEGAVRG